MPPRQGTLWGKDHPVVIFLGVFMSGFCDTTPNSKDFESYQEWGWKQ